MLSSALDELTDLARYLEGKDGGIDERLGDVLKLLRYCSLLIYRKLGVDNQETARRLVRVLFAASMIPRREFEAGITERDKVNEIYFEELHNNKAEVAEQKAFDAVVQWVGEVLNECCP